MRVALVLLLCAALANAADPSLAGDIDDYLGDELARDPYTLQDPAAKPKQPWLIISLGVWLPRLRGPINVQGRSIDIAKVLGLDDPATSFVPRVTARIGRIELTYEGYWLRYSGRKTLQQTITIPDPGGGPDIVFDIGETVDSTLNIGFSRLSLGYLFKKSRPLNISLGLGIGLYRLTGSITAVQTIQDHVSWSVYLPVPVLTLDIYGFAGKKVFWNVYIAGIGFSFDQVGAEAMDVMAAAGYMITPNIGIRAGYRATWIRARFSSTVQDSTDVRAAVEFSLQDGFFFDIVLIF